MKRPGIGHVDGDLLPGIRVGIDRQMPMRTLQPGAAARRDLSGAPGGIALFLDEELNFRPGRGGRSDGKRVFVQRKHRMADIQPGELPRAIGAVCRIVSNSRLGRAPERKPRLLTGG